MAPHSHEASLAPSASSYSSHPSTTAPLDRDHRNPAPGEQSVDTLALDIEVIDPNAFCSVIKEGPLAFGIIMPSIESLISAKSSIPADILDDEPSEPLPDHIPDV